jgi:hypothetical protein
MLSLIFEIIYVFGTFYNPSILISEIAIYIWVLNQLMILLNYAFSLIQLDYFRLKLYNNSINYQYSLSIILFLRIINDNFFTNLDLLFLITFYLIVSLYIHIYPSCFRFDGDKLKIESNYQEKHKSNTIDLILTLKEMMTRGFDLQSNNNNIDTNSYDFTSIHKHLEEHE